MVIPTYPRKPDFLIIGAQKCGTTWLWRMIDAHPGSDLPAKKEIHFFGASEKYNLGKSWYYEHFRGLDPEKVTGEASTTYFFDRMPYWYNAEPDLVFDDSLGSIPLLVNQELPDVKAIVVLRNPVRRAISAYHHLMKRAAVDRAQYGGSLSPATSLEEAGTKFPKMRILEYGFYSRYLQKWMEIFPSDRLKVLIFEDDVIAQPERTVLEIYRFIGLDDRYCPAKLREPANKSWGWTRIVAAYYLPSFLHEMTKRRPGKVLDRFNFLESFSVKPSDTEFLKGVYAEEKQRVENLIDRRISWSF